MRISAVDLATARPRAPYPMGRRGSVINVIYERVLLEDLQN